MGSHEEQTEVMKWGYREGGGSSKQGTVSRHCQANQQQDIESLLSR